MFGRLDYIEINSRAINKMLAVRQHISSIDPRLTALVELRVSQINGCSYCIDLHTTQALDNGEIKERIQDLSKWSESNLFTDSERAALAWAEAVTLLPETGAPDQAYREMTTHFKDLQIVDLTLIISQMNAFNRLAVSFRQAPSLHQ